MIPGEDNVKSLEVWRRTARSTAFVAGVFVILSIVLLIVNYFQGRASDPLNAPGLVALKAELEKRPTDEALKSRFRSLDRQVREEYFRREALADHANILLLCSVLVLLGAAEIARRVSRKLPSPGPGPVENVWSIAVRGRRPVACLGALAGAALLFMGLASRQDLAREYAEAVGVIGKAGRAAGGYASPEELARNWAGFRGPGSAGVVSPELLGTTDPGTWRWDGASGDGILWKASVPLPGKSSPIVWGDRVFLSGANESQREVYCFDANSGELLWRAAVGLGSSDQDRPQAVMEDTGYAASTMVTNGRGVFAIFATGHVAGFDFDGQPLWVRNLGAPDNRYGHASSLAMHQNRLIIQYDQGYGGDDSKSALLALDAATGATLWRTKRLAPTSWSTPIVVDTGKGMEIITSSDPWVIAYDPATGQERWRADCLGGDVAPTPIFAGGLIFTCNIGSYLAAIRPGGSGDVTETGIVWMAQDGLPDVTSPVSNGELLFLVNTIGLVTCYEAQSGAKLWEHELGASIWSSPTLLGNLIFVTDMDGVTRKFEAARSYREVGSSALGEKVVASPAFANGRMYLRGSEHLYCIAPGAGG